MAKITQIFVLLFCCLQFACVEGQFKLGVEQTNIYLPFLEAKKVALVGNQTTMLGKTHLVDSLLSLGVDIVKVFSPEHGFRGTADAGAKVSDGIDKQSGLPIISLYGQNKKPSPKQLDDVDIILFDIQDVGARFYTYISTLHYVMEAAAENDVSMIVLDRPNPNGHYVDGPVLDTAFRSFVGMHPVPIVHGMTIGEYAKMINGEDWISKPCNLLVVSMIFYQREKPYSLPIKPSPNLPNDKAVNLYPSLCLFEGTSVSVGRGTEYPFQHFGAPYLKESYMFTPVSGPGSKYPKHENKTCFGIDLRQNSLQTELNLDWLIDSYNNAPNKEKFFNNFFNNLAGTDLLKEQIISGMSSKAIKNNWQKDLVTFCEMRRPYLLY